MSGVFLSCRHHARSRIHKISSTRSKIIDDGGGGGGGGSTKCQVVGIYPVTKAMPQLTRHNHRPLRRREGLYKEFLCCIVKILFSIISCKQLAIDP